MGLNMRVYIKSYYFILSGLVFTGIPLLIRAMDDVAARSFLKDALSILTLLAFCQMAGQFFWARTNREAVDNLRMSRIVKYHKFIGYTCGSLLLLHPVFLVVPRFFEAGIAPAVAFTTLVTTLTSQGVVFGIIAWCFLLVLVLTALVRRKLPLDYRTWRGLHGIFAIGFILMSTWHFIDLGRHANVAFSVFIVILAAGGVLLLGRRYHLEAFKNSSEA